MQVFSINAYIFSHQWCVKLIESDSKDSYNVTKGLYFK